MENPDPSKFQFSIRTSRRCIRLLDRHDADKIEHFYMAFGFDARRQRFGGGISDHSIFKYCQGINWSRSILAARIGAYIPDAVLEIHAVHGTWRHAEIVLSSPLQEGCRQSFAQLLQLGALTAGARGCRSFIMHIDPSSCGALSLLSEMGQLKVSDDTACVELGDYAC